MSTLRGDANRRSRLLYYLIVCGDLARDTEQETRLSNIADSITATASRPTD